VTSCYIPQIFLWFAVQNQFCIRQRVVVNKIIQFRPLCAAALFKPSYPRLQLKGNGHVKQKRQWTVCLPVDIPTGWEQRRNLVVRALRVAFADFSAAPWQGFEKSERGPNNSSLFQPLAAVVVVAVQVLFRTEKEKPVHIVYWFFLVQESNPNPNHFPLMQLLSLLQRSRSVSLLYS
jgi:hypothetical protein